MGGLKTASRPARTLPALAGLLRTVQVLVAFAAAASSAPIASAATPLAVATLESTAHVDAAGRLQLDVHFDCSGAPPLAALGTAGLTATSTVQAGTLCVIEGWALPAVLPQLRAVPGVTRITAPSYIRPMPPRALRPVAHSLARGAVQRLSAATAGIDQYGVSIMRADQFVAQTGTSGAGVTVGVQSSGVYSLSAIQSRGELPPSIQVLYPAGNSTPVVADEGTMLLEQVHAVAPGAKLVYCGPTTFVDFTSCLTQLIGAGATILLDDTGFPGDDLMSQDNDQSSAVTQILAGNPDVMMLSSAGNNEGTYWEGNYAPVSAATTTLPALSCPAGSGTPDTYVAQFGTATSQTLSVIGSYATFPLLLAWATPPGQLTSKFDVFVFAADGTQVNCFSSAGSTTNETLVQLSLTGAPAPGLPYTLVVASGDASAAGMFLKLWAGGDGLTTLSVATPGGLVSPQAMVPGLLTIGAVNGSDGVGDTIEPFSSTGPLRVQFPAVAQLPAPTLVAPDGINDDATGTYFQGTLFPDGNFYGTSASVPNAAAVAALLRGAFPTLSVEQVTNALQNGATVLGAAAPDYVFGYGRVDALGALNTLPTPTISALVDQTSTGSASTSPQPFSITGTGTLHFSVSSSNPALVPSLIVSAGAAGVTLSSGCGSGTLDCTMSVMPVIGQAGTATVTLSVLDGANRAAPVRMTLTATDPAPAPPPPAPPAGSGGHGGGGTLQGWAVLWLGILVAWSQRRAPRPRRFDHR